MRVAVEFEDERYEIEVPEDRLVAHWRGPAGSGAADAERLVLEALEHPREYPPLRQAVVPGDQVVIALDPEVPRVRVVVDVVCRTLRDVGAGSITVLTSAGEGPGLAGVVPAGVELATHDPEDRASLAYLASTASGRRVYLNRLLTDADFVLPVGRLGFDPVLGYRGPWSTVFPGLSDRETARSFRAGASGEANAAALGESAEVSWLLGSQFHVGVVAGIDGPLEVVAGLDSAVRTQGAESVDRAWTFHAGSRADLVVAGIGGPGMPTGIDGLVQGLATAAQLVRRGGKIVALSRVEGALGPALHRLIGAGDPRLGAAALRGHEADPDFIAARSLARTLSWADVYLLSTLGQEAVEDLSMIALERPAEAQRLAATCDSCTVLSQAELTRAGVAEGD